MYTLTWIATDNMASIKNNYRLLVLIMIIYLIKLNYVIYLNYSEKVIDLKNLLVLEDFWNLKVY